MSSERRQGTISVNPRGFGFVSFWDGDEPTSAFVAPPDLNGLLRDDVVTGRLERDDAGYRLLEPKLLERKRSHLFGQVTLRKGKRLLSIDPEVSNTDWPLEGADDVKEGGWLVGKIEGQHVQMERSIAPADASLERVLVRYDLPTTFPRDVSGPRRLPASELQRRRDLRDMTTITIDAPISRDLDDAVAALPADAEGGVRVLVSIADVDALVPAGSDLDREARRRCTSVYLAGRVIPMLPRKLSEDALSLLPGMDRPSLTVELRIDPEGEVTAVDLYESVIRSNARLSYEQVARFLDHGDDGAVADELLPTLRWLRTAVARLDTVRSARGGVSLLREEATIHIDEDTREPTGLSARSDTTAHRLIERLMVAANEAVAGWLRDRGLPALYRVHDEPPPEKVAQLAEAAKNFGLEAGLGARLTPRALASFERQFAGRANAPALYTVLGQMLGPARYSAEPAPHFGLAARLYLHFTSPIRRYADLAVHRVVKAYLNGLRTPEVDLGDLEALAEVVTDVSRRADKAEQDRLRMLAARFFAGRIGERMRGNIVMVRPFGLLVQLEKTGISGGIARDQLPGKGYEVDRDGFALVGKQQRFVLGQSLEVQVASADEILGRIELRLAPER